MKPAPHLPRHSFRMPIGIGISLLLHAALLLLFSAQAPRPPDSVGSGSQVPLVVELSRQPLGQKTVPPPQASPSPPAPAPPPPPQRRKPGPATRKPPAARPTAPAGAAVSPRLPSDTRPVPAAPAQENTAPPSDMSEMVEAARARRRAAGVAAPEEPANQEDARPQGDEVARANIARSLAQAPGRSGGGGIFHITHKGVRTAEFLFRGWDGGSRAGGRELVQVDAGPNGNVEDAIVRKMIEIIRKRQSGDFNWDSRRLGRVVSLSARKEDGAGLEDFLKQEFFSNPR